MALEGSKEYSFLHCCRRSEDTALFVLKEVYEEMNPELIKA